MFQFLGVLGALGGIGVLIYNVCMSFHTAFDEEEARFIHGQRVKVIQGFYQGCQGTISELHKATTLSHGWVGYKVKADDGMVTPFIPVDELEAA